MYVTLLSYISEWIPEWLQEKMQENEFSWMYLDIFQQLNC